MPSRPWAKPGQGAQRHSVSHLTLSSEILKFPHLQRRRGRREGPRDCVWCGEAFEKICEYVGGKKNRVLLLVGQKETAFLPVLLKEHGALPWWVKISGTICCSVDLALCYKSRVMSLECRIRNM